MNPIKEEIIKKRVARDPVYYADVADVLARGAGEILIVSDSGFLIYNIPGDVMIAEADDDHTFLRIAEEILAHNSEIVLLHGRAYAEALERYGYTEDMVCRQFVYTGTTPLAVRPDGFEIRRIPDSCAAEVRRLYSRMEDAQYIAQRMQAGMYGAFVGEKLCGIIGTHAEGSIGLLEVDSAYRKRGMGRALEAFMINKMLDAGRIPYGQVVVGNDISAGLQQSLCLKASENTVSWFFKK